MDCICISSLGDVFCRRVKSKQVPLRAGKQDTYDSAHGWTVRGQLRKLVRVPAVIAAAVVRLLVIVVTSSGPMVRVRRELGVDGRLGAAAEGRRAR